MNRDFPEDTFTENDVIRVLDNAGLSHKNMHRYILIQCPTHEDKNPSAQVYKDDWFVNCHATCGRYHITKAFPELRNNNNQLPKERKVLKAMRYKKYDLMDWWKALPLIPRDHKFKGIDLETLDELGWRWDEPQQSYFIPYFSRSKKSLPFGQWRHLKGDRRFTFLKDAKPTLYGTWNLVPGEPIILVEGASDGAVLDFCSIPWIAAPSASSSELVKAMAGWCNENDIQVIFGGDNDEAGAKIKEALASVTHYATHQPPKKYKDWGDFFEAEGFEAVYNYAMIAFYKPSSDIPEFKQEYPNTKDEVQAVLDIFPDSKVLEIIDSSKSSKELSKRSYH
ncbi:hypothetical protein EKK58_09430 [Candidatus Dependentiae bacterium]|nr:MAG: hypothetical protein EKK58_09430 [Candidatus Dependentiae bacterium]